MRYDTNRKYPITKMKKDNQLKKPESYIDLTVGAAVGLLAVVFAEGLFWGYMIRKWRC